MCCTALSGHSLTLLECFFSCVAVGFPFVMTSTMSRNLFLLFAFPFSVPFGACSKADEGSIFSENLAPCCNSLQQWCKNVHPKPANYNALYSAQILQLTLALFPKKCKALSVTMGGSAPGPCIFFAYMRASHSILPEKYSHPVFRKDEKVCSRAKIDKILFLLWMISLC